MPAITVLRTALHAALAQDETIRDILGPGGVHDAAPHGARPPYGLVETVASSPVAGAEGEGGEHLLDIAFWTGERGRRKAELLAHAARLAVAALQLPLPDRLANIGSLSIRTGRDPATQWHFARLRIRAVVETPGEGV